MNWEQTNPFLLIGMVKLFTNYLMYPGKEEPAMHGMDIGLQKY